MVGDCEYNKTKYNENEEEVDTGIMWRNGNSEDDNNKGDYKN
jgi:hypothetical protein